MLYKLNRLDVWISRHIVGIASLLSIHAEGNPVGLDYPRCDSSAISYYVM